MTSTKTKLVLDSDARDAVLSHAREGAGDGPPREVCGVLVGARANESGTGPDRVRSVRRVRNVAANRRVAYELDPEETLGTLESIDSEGRDVVGFYHSHPESEPVPSDADREQATWSGYVYLVCSPDGRLNAYRWTGSAFEPLRVVVE